MPLPAPMAAPVSKVATTTSQAGRPSTNRQNSAAKLQSDENRADAEVDATGNQAEGHAERDKAEFGERPSAPGVRNVP